MLVLGACSDPAPPSVVQGRSTSAPGVACAPASPVPSVPPTPQDLALPAGSVVTAYSGSASEVLLTGRTTATVDQVLAHFRTAVERAGFVLQRDEDEGRSGELVFFGARAEGGVTVARLTCPRGQTGFTVRVRGA